MKNTIEQTMVNGFDTGAFGGLVDLLKDHPKGGRVTFLSSTKWEEGAQVSTQLSGYKIDGELHHQRELRFVVKGDEPSSRRHSFCRKDGIVVE